MIGYSYNNPSLIIIALMMNQGSIGLGKYEDWLRLNLGLED